jgi:hypothetical protein
MYKQMRQNFVFVLKKKCKHHSEKVATNLSKELKIVGINDNRSQTLTQVMVYIIYLAHNINELLVMRHKTPKKCHDINWSAGVNVIFIRTSSNI